MRRRIFAVLCLWWLAALPGWAQHKSESEAKEVRESTGPTEHGNLVLWGWVNFLLLTGGLIYIIRKNAAPYFAQRSLEIRRGIAEAEEVRAEAESRIAEVESLLANLETEIEAMRQEALKEQEAEAQRARQHAAAELAKIQARLRDEIVSAGKTARLELRRHSAELALKLAQQKIAAQMSPGIEERLVANFIEHLARPAVQVQST
jgi:F-type H+-transporting ATPase subunit b